MDSLYIRIALLLAFALLTQGQQCTNDYQCANVPYTRCKGGLDECQFTIAGLAIDYGKNQIYYGQNCRGEYGGEYNSTFRRVSASSGAPLVVKSSVNGFRAPTPYNIFDVYGNNLYFITYTLMTLNLQDQSTETIVQFPSGEYFAGGLDFDRQQQKSYACTYGGSDFDNFYHLYKFEGILGQGNPTGQLLYRFSDFCTAVRSQANSDNVYVAATSYNATLGGISKFYKGSKKCQNCTSLQLLFTLYNETVSDFVISNGKFYYTSDRGVFYATFNGQSIVQVSSDSATGIQTANGKIFWNNGKAIFSASLDGSSTKQINVDQGKCTCSYGFSGQNCATCNGQTQWYYGQPSCVTLKGNGQPERCHYDYECGNQPWTQCWTYAFNNTCQCRYGFTGDTCQQCIDQSKSIVWSEYGTPSCQ